MVRCLLVFLVLVGCSHERTAIIFTKTNGWRHTSIPVGIDAVTTMSESLGFNVVATEDPEVLETADYDLLVFVHPTGEILNDSQRAALRTFVEQGGAFVGVHAAADAEREHSWYGNTLIGAVFVHHNQIHALDVEVVDQSHPSTQHLGSLWPRTDEWYIYDRTPENVTVLLVIEDEDGRRPIAWCRDVGKGRSFYTGGGHTIASWSEPKFLEHVRGGIGWATRTNTDPN